MTMRIEWRNGASTLPDGATLLVAFPGVANLGKVAVDSIGNLHDGVELARLHPIGLPLTLNLMKTVCWPLRTTACDASILRQATC